MATTQAAAATSTSHPYTCNTCQVAYRNIDLQKSHMKSDWHRYNLKRRVASLPPISSDVFTDKVLQARAVSTAEADKAYFERACEACEKTYYSENAYQNHLSSQKHKLKESASSGQPTPVRTDDETTSVISSTFSLGEPLATSREEVDSDAEEEFNHVVEGLQNASIAQQRPSPVKRPSNPPPSTEQTSDEVDTTEARGSNSATPVQAVQEPVWTLESCLFCNYSSPTVPLNAHHMERFHGMFIPEKKYLVDIDGLLRQLQDKIREAHRCLYCDKFKSSIFGIQTHMRDKGHCKIPFSTEAEQLEIGDFYDFRSTYSDDDGSTDDGSTVDEPSGGAKLGARRAFKLTKDDGEEIEGDEEGDGWETDSSASSLDSADLTAVPAEGHIHQFERLDKHPHHSRNDPRNRHQADGWHSHAHKHTHAVFYDEYELHLPTGKAVGHRSLNKYYRQNLHNHPSAEERAEQLAIKAAQDPEVGESGDTSLVQANSRRQMVPRGEAGLVGATSQQKKDLRKAEVRGRNLQTFNTKRNDYMYGKKLNNHENYYYREQGGG
ncbi:C2H2 type zinc-finger-domain-containing protein [Dactylonectria macrodidyma]|uniref:C2H2 type zinc-finger-domain-containing protein n=1 Tax=Dactylonectria macrodidyma TaxID=307937 RepID=A0A9P9FGY1_9HYPO|nr:C2H2 type zinc-finger-domain-containing protein [Dactylonectria macrodidyma]